MKYLDIAKLQTTISVEEMRSMIAGGCKGAHESILRSWSILAEVKYLLGRNVDPETILKIIEVMEAKPTAVDEATR